MTDTTDRPGHPGRRAAARRAGHVLVDALVATAPTGDAHTDFHEPAIQTALARIFEVDAIRVTAPPGTTGPFTVDVTPVLNGALSLMHWLVYQLAQCAGADYDDVLIDLRQQLADWERDAG